MSKKIAAFLALSLLPTLAFAHPGHGDGSFLPAFAHPFTGIDHLLMMLGVGLWAGRSGGAARWQLPLTFLTSMLGGWAIGANNLSVPGVETGIAAGLIALGALLIAQTTLPRMLQLAIIAGFALLHGMAHGIELGTVQFSTSATLLAAVGFLSAGAVLHGAGIGLAALLPKDRATIYRALGAVLALVGGGILVAA